MTEASDIMERLFEEAAELAAKLPLGGGAPSTPQTRERYAFLKSKPYGSTWTDGDRLYKRTDNGVTVIDTSKWSGMDWSPAP